MAVQIVVRLIRFCASVGSDGFAGGHDLEGSKAAFKQTVRQSIPEELPVLRCAQVSPVHKELADAVVQQAETGMRLKRCVRKVQNAAKAIIDKDGIGLELGAKKIRGSLEYDVLEQDLVFSFRRCLPKGGPGKIRQIGKMDILDRKTLKLGFPRIEDPLDGRGAVLTVPVKLSDHGAAKVSPAFPSRLDKSKPSLDCCFPKT